MLVAVAAAAFGLGIVIGSLDDSGTVRTAEQFTRAWERGDYAEMHRLIGPGDRGRAPLAAFRAAYARAAATATIESIDAGRVREDDGRVRVPVVVRTRIFGPVRGTLVLHVTDERIDWDRSLVFPGLHGSERLSRVTQAPARASIVARDGREIVSGPATTRAPSGTLGSSIAGAVGPAEHEQLGVPPGRGSGGRRFGEGGRHGNEAAVMLPEGERGA